MTQEEYIKDRIDDQIKWYGKKSSFCQKKHKFWQVVKIISALLITSLSLWASSEVSFKDAYDLVLENLKIKNEDDNSYYITLSHVIGILGAFIVFVESFVKIFDYEKLWIQYRGAAERLKREKLLFQTGTTPYDTKDAFSMLVQNCEGIMENEVQGWVKLQTDKEKEKENEKNQ